MGRRSWWFRINIIMAEFKINSITDKSGYCGPVISGVSTNNSTGCMIIPAGPTEFRGGRGRGVIGGGHSPASGGIEVDTIERIEIATAGNSVDFGNLTEARRDLGSASSSIRGVFAGGGFPSVKTTIDYLIFSSQGGGNDFGELPISYFQPSGTSNDVRGLFAGGVKPSPTRGYDNIEFVTIATTGDSTEFGNLSTVRWAAAGVNSSTRAIYGGGTGAPTYTNLIEFVTIATLGNPTDFGDLSSPARNVFPACNSTRGIFAGGQTDPASPYGYTNTVEYITMSTLGDTTNFGDLTQARARGAGISGTTRGVFLGGIIFTNPGTGSTNVIDFITIASTGNAQDFGDLLQDINRSGAGASDSHGGLIQ